MVQDIRRKDRRTPMKVLVAKTFQFVDRIWLTYTRKRWLDSGYGKHRLLISFYTFIEDINYFILVRLRRRERRERRRGFQMRCMMDWRWRRKKMSGFRQ